MSKIFKSLSLLGVITCVAMLAVSPAGATLLGTTLTPTGTTVFPGSATGDPAGTLLADEVEPFSLVTTAGVLSGTLESAVYQEAGGTLDFYYQVNNTSTSTVGTPDTIEHANGSSFAGWDTYTGFRIDGSTLAGTTFTNSNLTPDTANRNVTGTVVEFNYNVFGVDDVPSGQSTSVLVISTNATHYVAGNASAIDSGTATVPSYQPAISSQVPEPASIALLGSILFGIAAIGRRRLSR